MSGLAAREHVRRRALAPGAARTALLYVFPALLILTSWLALEDPRRSGRAVGAALLALVPALVRPLWARALAGLAVIVLVLPGAFGLSPFVAGDYGRTAARFGGGALAFYDVGVPFDPSLHPRMQGVVVVAVLGFCLTLALALAARRPLVAAIVVAAGAAWPATILPERNRLLLGGFLLAAVLVLFAGMRRHGGSALRPAVVGGVAVLVAALAASTAPAVAKNAFLPWEQWDLNRPADPPVSVSYVWNSQYGGIRFPEKSTTVLRIRAPARPQYWRATVLDVFDGYGWIEGNLNPIVPRRDGPRDVLVEGGEFPSSARDSGRWVRQQVEVAALKDGHLIGGSVPVAYAVDPEQDVAYAAGGIAAADIHRGTRYSVWSFAPEPGPKRLVRTRPRYPGPVLERDLRVGPLALPPFGSPSRDARVQALLSRYASDPLGSYQAVYERARALTADAESPYQAAVALELWLRTAGGFTYEEQPPKAAGVPPLVDFVTRTKSGYCQHFAGAMALMLRYLGIPARVAAGFTSGRYDRGSGVWTVTDHDAHTWVEAWFDGFGWLPFDPTPGRGTLDASYTAASPGFDPSGAGGSLAQALGLTPQALQDRIAHGAALVQGTRLGPGETGGGSDRFRTRGSSLVGLLLLVALGAIVLVAVAKVAVRRARYLTRDPREISTACRRELVDFLRDQRLEPTEAATLAELDHTIDEALSISSRHFVEAATAARFAPAARAAADAERARRELRTLLRRIRRRLSAAERARGLVSLRSLGFR